MKSITYFILLILIVSISTDSKKCEDISPASKKLVKNIKI